MAEVLDRPVEVSHEAAARCPYYDEDCKEVKDHFACWSGLDTDDPFPGSCPFVFRGDE